MDMHHVSLLEHRVYTMPKVGLGIESIEDIVATHPEGQRFVAAISDGATQAFAAARWAHLLVEQFVMHPRISVISQAWLDPIKDAYRAQVDFAALPWHALKKAGHGSFATLLGLVIDRSRCRYRAIAVGDSCLVTLDGTVPKPLVEVFPRYLVDAAAFTNSPDLVATNPAYNARLPQIQQNTGWKSLPQRATFLLMTDALAAWFVSAHSRGEKPWERITNLRSDDEFAHLVISLREAGDLRDDDTTLLIVQVSEDDP